MLGLGNTIIGGAVLEGAAWDPSNLGSTLIAWYKNNTGLINASGTDGTADNRLQWSDEYGNNNHIIKDKNSSKHEIDLSRKQKWLTLRPHTYQSQSARSHYTTQTN